MADNSARIQLLQEWLIAARTYTAGESSFCEFANITGQISRVLETNDGPRTVEYNPLEVLPPLLNYKPLLTALDVAKNASAVVFTLAGQAGLPRPDGNDVVDGILLSQAMATGFSAELALSNTTALLLLEAAKNSLLSKPEAQELLHAIQDRNHQRRREVQALPYIPG